MTRHNALFSIIAALVLTACATGDSLPPQAQLGPSPVLPPAQHGVIPIINIAPALGWPNGGQPRAATGFQVAAFAVGLNHPRWLYVLPNGDVLVAETNAPKKESQGGIREWVMGLIEKEAGGAVPSPDRIVLLRDADGDGVAETRTVFLQGLHSPFGMALVGEQLYVANTDAVLVFPYRTGETSIAAPGRKLVDLPAGEINYHWTKSLVASRDGSRLYVGVGSTSNAAEHGIEKEEGRAAIWEIDRATGRARIFASGLRNPVGLAWQPQSGALWVVVNERDELGDDLVPDYLTSVREGAFYGWPYSYYGNHVDTRVKPQRPDLVARAIEPDYALGSHVAALGLAFYEGRGLPLRYQGGAFIGMHGSWNRSQPSGYKVVFVPFSNGAPSGPTEDVLTGFLNDQGKAQGRPVGVAVDGRGAVLVADDVGNAIWRVTYGAVAASAE